MNQIENQKFPEAFAQAEQYFENEKINFPYISNEDKRKLTVISKEVFGTLSQPPAPLYDIELYVKGALTHPRDFILFGVDGHGFESRGMHYYAVKKHVAIFIQINMGALLDQESVHQRINGIFHGVSLIFDSLQEADQKNLLPEGKRLLIIDSDFYGSGWEWITGNPGKINKAEWNTEGLTLLSALNSIPY